MSYMMCVRLIASLYYCRCYDGFSVERGIRVKFHQDLKIYFFYLLQKKKLFQLNFVILIVSWALKGNNSFTFNSSQLTSFIFIMQRT